MPHYYFHVFNDEISLDDEGRELPSLEAAREIAVRAARGLACAEIQKGRLTLGHRIEIEDEAGTRTPVRYDEAFTVQD